MTRVLNVVAVDDEPLALRRLAVILENMPDITLAGTASSCREGLEVISERQPDVLLLDIRLRDGTGFDLLDKCAVVPTPQVIFVTAFDHYAVDAFERAAIDYLLKPIEPQRLLSALNRARMHLGDNRNDARLEELQEVIANLRAALREQTEDADDSHLWVRSANGSYARVAIMDVDWFSSEDDYVRLHVGSRSFLIRSSLKALELKLDPAQFARVHRSALVRLSAIDQVKRRSAARRDLILKDGTKIPTGRVHFRALRTSLRKMDLLSEDD